MSAKGFSNSLELIRRAKAGEAAARDELLERYRGRLLERVRLMMGGAARRAADSSDFLHGVFAEILTRLEDFEIRDEKGFLRWATTIARNGIRESVRQHREQAFESLSGSRALDADTDVGAPSPASAADARDRLFRLADALDELGDAPRELIELHALEGLSFREIAERQQTSKTSARRSYNKAMLDLGRLMLGESG